jgi:hypothetical protein
MSGAERGGWDDGGRRVGGAWTWPRGCGSDGRRGCGAGVRGEACESGPGKKCKTGGGKVCGDQSRDGGELWQELRKVAKLWRESVRCVCVVCMVWGVCVRGLRGGGSVEKRVIACWCCVRVAACVLHVELR